MPDYCINYESTDPQAKIPRSQQIITTPQSIEDAFYFAAALEADSFLESGEWDGSFTVVPRFKNNRKK